MTYHSNAVFLTNFLERRKGEVRASEKVRAEPVRKGPGA
jgi:hypothetical protein